MKYMYLKKYKYLRRVKWVTRRGGMKTLHKKSTKKNIAYCREKTGVIRILRKILVCRKPVVWRRLMWIQRVENKTRTKSYDVFGTYTRERKKSDIRKIKY